MFSGHGLDRYVLGPAVFIHVQKMDRRKQLTITTAYETVQDIGGNTMTQAQFNQLSSGDTVTGPAVVRGIRLICTVSVKKSKKGIQKLAMHAGCGVCSTIDPKTWEVAN